MLAVMCVLPVICYLVLPSPIDTFGAMGCNIGMIFIFRKMIGGIVAGRFGEKLKFECLACNGTKFDSKGACVRCGSKTRRTI
jgi:hypothetical protein